MWVVIDYSAGNPTQENFSRSVPTNHHSAQFRLVHCTAGQTTERTHAAKKQNSAISQNWKSLHVGGKLNTWSSNFQWLVELMFAAFLKQISSNLIDKRHCFQAKIATGPKTFYICLIIRSALFPNYFSFCIIISSTGEVNLSGIYKQISWTADC